METSNESPWLSKSKLSNFFASEFLNEVFGVGTESILSIITDNHGKDLLETTVFDFLQLVIELSIMASVAMGIVCLSMLYCESVGIDNRESYTTH